MTATAINSGSFARRVEKAITLAGSNATVRTDLFKVSGSVKMRIWGVVTTVIGANHTAGHLQVDDGTAQDLITAAAGVTISTFEAGSLISKEGLVATALTGTQADQGRVEEPAAAGDPSLQEFTVTANPAADTHIEYSYATTDTPTTGAIKWFCEWEPMDDNGLVEAA